MYGIEQVYRFYVRLATGPGSLKSIWILAPVTGRISGSLQAAPSAAESPSRAETQAGSAAPSAAESPRQRRKSLFGGNFGSRKACLPSHVRRPKVLRLPNLVSAKGQKLGSFMHICLLTLPTCI